MPMIEPIGDDMSKLRVTSIQSVLHWENESANLSMFEEKLAALKGQTDLVVLPEMFNSGFSMTPKAIAQAADGATIGWMCRQAEKLEAAICGSLAVLFEGEYYNQFVFVHPSGRIDRYNKRHCFRMSGEHEVYRSGSQRVVIDYRGWRILPQVCYDLRFPVFSRAKNDYDLMIYVANCPQARRAPWRCLLQARAIENQSYVVGVNRIGEDANGIAYSGDSLSIDYLGEISFDSAAASVSDTQTLHLDRLASYRKKFPAWMDADDFELNS